MDRTIKKNQKKRIILISIYLLCTLFSLFFIVRSEQSSIKVLLDTQAAQIQNGFEETIANTVRSFRIFERMMSREIEVSKTPEAVSSALKTWDAPLLDIEGPDFAGLSMFYQGHYLYSWDTAYSVYESMDYDPAAQLWYTLAVQADGDIAYTPPHKRLTAPIMITTISRLQPDGETVFAYDFQLGAIQSLTSELGGAKDTLAVICSMDGIIISCTDETFLGENEQLPLQNSAPSWSAPISQIDHGDYRIYVTASIPALLACTMDTWFVPLLCIQLLLIFLLALCNRAIRNRDLQRAYVELGQMQKRLEIALVAAQRSAAVDELTGIMNERSFKTEMQAILESMQPDNHGILIMIDGDHFKQVNDNFGHLAGDAVIKLTAQMIVGRIRTVDFAARLHGDEFAIYIADTEDFSVAQRIMEDINHSITKEAAKRSMPSITLSAGAARVSRSNQYEQLVKIADDALYCAKESHNGRFISES